MTMAMVKLSFPPTHIEEAWRTLREHEHDPITGICPIDGRAECLPFREARGDLALAGLLDWDPLEEMARHRRWLSHLGDR
ncbi:hypothetical protein Rhe02_55850 [Rhizocola hellebori]|uniref:Uncharacterized protein n=1 Tax=Rhizocola hellebori TaxID=1392758 RepID=A0A8J3QB08_9ACTN|nr:hypothetical protein [Rhizocola hellebori]GIH07518.1 hypothetical protein Rhe02_55850 [Rhizocola hellebori]